MGKDKKDAPYYLMLASKQLDQHEQEFPLSNDLEENKDDLKLDFNSLAESIGAKKTKSKNKHHI